MHTHTHKWTNTYGGDKQCFYFLLVSLWTALNTIIKKFHHMMKSPSSTIRQWRYGSIYLLFAACSKSLISFIILLICCDVFSSSFSWRFKFSRNSGESRRQSANSSAAKPDPPLITILTLSLTHQFFSKPTNPPYLLSYSFAIKYLLFIYWIILTGLRSSSLLISFSSQVCAINKSKIKLITFDVTS